MTPPFAEPHPFVGDCRSLVELLRFRAERAPDQLAYQFLIDGHQEGPRLTYRQLCSEAHAVAMRLSKSAEPGSRALLLYPQGVDFLVAFFGCLQAGMIPVPLPPPDAARMKRSLPRLKSVIEDSQAALVLTTGEMFATRHQQFDAELASLCWLSTDALPIDAESATGAFVEAQPCFDDVAFLQYTSGSTSTPKGVMATCSINVGC